MLSASSQPQPQVPLAKNSLADVRLYTKAPGTAYLLPSDEEERQRLTVQHHLIKKSFDGLIHVPIQLTQEDHVLESGTGTGAWLLDVAEEAPLKTQLVGFDIEGQLFPESSTLPANIDFCVHSVLDLPKEWTNKFTLVHQRLLIAALRTTEWLQALRELHRVTKPGGWVQLVERDSWVAGATMNVFRSMVAKLQESRNIAVWSDIGLALQGLLKEYGYVDIRVVRGTSPLSGPYGSDGRSNLLALFRGMKTPILKGGGFGIVSNEAMYNEMLDQVLHEMESTESAEIRWVMVCARKPE